MDFLARSIFTFDKFWGSLGTSIFLNSASATNNIQFRLPSSYLSLSYDYDFYYQCYWNRYNVILYWICHKIVYSMFITLYLNWRFLYYIDLISSCFNLVFIYCPLSNELKYYQILWNVCVTGLLCDIYIFRWSKLLFLRF